MKSKYAMPIGLLSLAIAMTSLATADSIPDPPDAGGGAVGARPDEADQIRAQATSEERGADERSLVVTATAYNSLASQTDSDPTTAAWGDRLSPGMKAIAVSRDLIPLGLAHRATVSIDGLPGSFRVLDKMNGRWSKRIDIYMGNDVDAARAWGRREVRIRW